jgi:nucleoside-diphosphate-sugar epimerase
VRPAASEVERLISDPSLAQELTGWSAEVDLREGLARTLDWIASNTQRYRASDYVI